MLDKYLGHLVSSEMLINDDEQIYINNFLLINSNYNLNLLKISCLRIKNEEVL